MKQIRNFFKSLNDNYKNIPTMKSKSNKTFDINFFEKISVKYDNFLFKRLKIEKEHIFIRQNQ